MDLQLINKDILKKLDVSVKVPIHRNMDHAETIVCFEGCLDVVFYQELPNMDAGGPIHDGETAFDETCFAETARVRVCPRDGQYGVQVPVYIWHSIEVHEPSTILEAKDGAYAPSKE